MLGGNPGKPKLLGEGAVAEVYALSGKWVCKRPKPGQKDALLQERELLQAVKERWPKGIPLPIPDLPGPEEQSRILLPRQCGGRESILIQENLSSCPTWEEAWTKVGGSREKWHRWWMGALFLERYALLLATLHEVGFLQGPDRKLEDCRLCSGASSPPQGAGPSGGREDRKAFSSGGTSYSEEEGPAEALGASGPSGQFPGSAQGSFFAGTSTDRFTERPSVLSPTDAERVVILDWNVIQRRKDGETEAEWEDRCREDALQVLYLWWRWAAPKEVRDTPPSTADDWRWQVHRREWGDWITDMLRFYVFRGDLRSLARDAFLLRRFLEILPEVLSSGPEEGVPSIRRSIKEAWREWHALVPPDLAGKSLEPEDLERLIDTLISAGLGLYFAAVLEGRTGSSEDGGWGRAYYRQVASWYEKVDKALRSQRRLLERAYEPGDLESALFESRDAWKDLDTLEHGLERLPFFFRDSRPLLEYRVLTVFEDFLRTQKHFREARRRWQGMVFGFTADSPPGRRWLGWPRQSIPSGLKSLWWLAQCFAGAPCPPEGQQSFSPLLNDLTTLPLEQRWSAAPSAQDAAAVEYFSLACERANAQALLNRLRHGEGDGRQVWEQVTQLGRENPLTADLLRAWNERIESLAWRFFPFESRPSGNHVVVALAPFEKGGDVAQGSGEQEMKFLSWKAWQELSPEKGRDLLTAYPGLERFVVHPPASEPTLVKALGQDGEPVAGTLRQRISWVDRATLQFDLLSRENRSLASSWQNLQHTISDLTQKWREQQQPLLHAIQRLQESLHRREIHQEAVQAFQQKGERLSTPKEQDGVEISRSDEQPGKEEKRRWRRGWLQFLVAVAVLFLAVVMVGGGWVVIRLWRPPNLVGGTPSPKAEALSSLTLPTPTAAPVHLRARLELGESNERGAYPHLVGSVRPYRLTLTGPTAQSYYRPLSSLALEAEPPGAVEYCSGPGADTCRALPQTVTWAPDQLLHLRLTQPQARLTLHSDSPAVALNETVDLKGVAWETLYWRAEPAGPRIPGQPVWRLAVTGLQGEAYPAPVLAAPWAPEQVWLPGVEGPQPPQTATLTWGPYTLTLTAGAGASIKSGIPQAPGQGPEQTPPGSPFAPPSPAAPQAQVQWEGHTAPVEGAQWVCVTRIIGRGYVWRWEPKVNPTTLMVGDANAVKALLQALPNQDLCVSAVGKEEKKDAQVNVHFRSFTLPGWVWEATEKDQQGKDVTVLKFHPYRVGAPEALTLENSEAWHQELLQDRNGYRLTEEDKKALGLGAEAPAQVWFVSLQGWVSIEAIQSGK